MIMNQGGTLLINGIRAIFAMIVEILYFPLWWYSRGVTKLSKLLIRWLAEREKELALIIWIKNIGKPMYSQYSWEGIIISFFVRLFQIAARSIILLIYVAAALAVFCFWLIAPPLFIYEIWFQLQDYFLKGSLYLFLMDF